ncbi:hypothetical protein GCK72_008434 [Caenorhabditis remanei]|uniref:ABC transporter domain-containing protein n=1 Tax=Caenorhabditis remanei TaxID=31234 RepID=A0A6A5GXK9_CAERE|nr:hypothetical protein GCK72_008434 [Caenorhabditis remanei]KAF1760188.1 hypothetical protein GCK72_008434 [Caenorhabditis remanei]
MCPEPAGSAVTLEAALQRSFTKMSRSEMLQRRSWTLACSGLFLTAWKHLHEELPLDLSALEFMMKEFPDVKEKEEMRKIVGRYGITGREQVCPMKQLSDGQRCRVSFAWLAWQQPHLLLLDEPTNHLDMESIDALAEAINCFPGGMILVSHDFRLVSQVAEEVWVCDNQGIQKWDGDIFSFKDHLRKQIDKDVKNRGEGLVKER